MADGHVPLTWEASDPAAPMPSDRLPEEVVTCLQNARFLHLATCTSNQPHVSLMNYTYLPPSIRPPPSSSGTNPPNPTPSTFPSGPTIIMTSNPHSKKTTNLLTNPNVSLLVHDWVSSRPAAPVTDPTASSTTNSAGTTRERSPVDSRRRQQSTLAGMLMQMNAAAMSSISATMNGYAHVLPVGSAEEKWCKAQHLANNTFGGEQELDAVAEEGPGVGDRQVASGFRRPVEQRRLSLTASAGGAGAGVREGDGGRESYIRDEEVRVVVVELRDGRISDWKGGVKDWVIARPGEGEQSRLVNGI